VLRPVGTPLPLGFVGLVVASVVLSCLNLGWIRSAEQHQVALVLIAFPFPLQGLAAILCFLARDAPVGAGMGVQAGAWLTLGVLLLTAAPGARSDTGSIFLFAAAAALIPAAFTATLTKVVPSLVFFGTAARFVLTGLYERFGGGAWAHAAGWEGIALAGLALYAALATDLEASQHRTVLPLGRRGPGTAPATEPAVRSQL
jgi:succinate-acetate transporter protein